MESLTPRKIKAEQTRQKILDTALDIFSRKSFDETTVDEIVKQSGTSKGAFYTHFKSKYEIFLEKFKEIDTYYLTFTKSFPENASASEKVLLFAKKQMMYLRDRWGKSLFRTLYTNASPDNDYFLNKNRALYKIVFQFVSEGQKSGEFTQSHTVEEMTTLITRCMRGTLFDWCISHQQFDLIGETEKLLSTLLTGFRNHENT